MLISSRNLSPRNPLPVRRDNCSCKLTTVKERTTPHLAISCNSIGTRTLPSTLCLRQSSAHVKWAHRRICYNAGAETRPRRHDCSQTQAHSSTSVILRRLGALVSRRLRTPGRVLAAITHAVLRYNRHCKGQDRWTNSVGRTNPGPLNQGTCTWSAAELEASSQPQNWSLTLRYTSKQIENICFATAGKQESQSTPCGPCATTKAKYKAREQEQHRSLQH